MPEVEPPRPGDFNDPRNKWEYFKAHTWWGFTSWLSEVEDAMMGCFTRIMIWVCMFALIFCCIGFVVALIRSHAK